MEAAAQTLSGAAAVGACAAMALLYVGILYSPTVLRLPPPTTLDSFLIRRFVCAAVASTVSVVACAVLLGIRNFEAIPSIFGILGMRVDHWGRALVFALLLTSLPYAGSLVSKLVAFVHVQNEAETSSRQGEVSEMEARGILDSIHEVAANILTWRNYVVAPLTEEIVFRACMIPLLLCGGFKTSTVIFCSPIFFSLAHLNHFLELYCQRRYTFLKVFTIVVAFAECTAGLQLGYTVIFGWYASFLFIRTGNLICPIVAHIFCNVMGLHVLSSSHAKGQ
ncbi:hypothetical protein Taro_051056 [Colocasia esculenta]|uniref:intramembrane prenyl-peptidase Rce1 n=1 Tax=Colocasia esculenta TaxID=4460 RepID=A0A843XFR8_COLES|nr:hypothetical protein [Colocasia esculenta]